jgi:hypothetical protein
MTAKYFFVFRRPEVKFIDSKILSELQGKNIKDVRPLYGISENGHQNLEEYLRNKLKYEQKNITLVEQKNPKMKTMALNPTEFPTQHLGTEITGRNIGEPSKTANPSKTEITRDKCGQQRCWKWTCRHNRSIWKRKTRRSIDGTQPQNDEKNEGAKIPWAESYPERTVSNREKLNKFNK